MADQFDELIREIAIKHGIAVSREDPILMLQTINARMLQESAQAHQAQLNGQKEELEVMAMRWEADAKNRAERILNAALTASTDAMVQLMQEGASVTVASLRVEIEATLARIASQAEQIRQIAIFNIMAACITMASAAITLFGLFHK